MRLSLLCLALILALAAPAVAVKQPAGPDRIVGTRHADVLQGGNSPDVVIGKAGADRIWGNRAPDVLRGGPGRDVLHGFGSGAARDVLRGGRGRDRCIGTLRDVFRSCEVKVVRRGLGPRG